MKLFKKIGLILLTGTMFFYLGYSLLRGTYSTDSETPVNSSFDDINFYKCVVDNYNRENNTSVGYDENLSEEQLSSIRSLYCQSNEMNTAKGIEKLTSTTYMDFSWSDLVELDVSNNSALVELRVVSNQLTTLNISGTSSLSILSVGNNQLTELDVSKNTALTKLSVSENKLTSLDVSNNLLLTELSVYGNQLTNLDVSKNLNLVELELSLNSDGNLLTELDVSNNLALEKLYVGNNKLKNIDVSNNLSLTKLDIRNNQLTELDVSNNDELTTLYIYDNLFSDTYNVYKNANITLEEKIKLPSSLADSSSTWETNDVSVATVDSSSGVVSGVSVGTVKINKTYSNSSYSYYHTVNVVEITSDKYDIDDTNNNIYIGVDSDIDTIKSNINVSDEGINLNIELNNYKLQVEYANEILKEFKLLSIKFKNYNIVGKNILALKQVSYEDFISNVTASDGITYKLFNEEEEVTGGTVSSGMKLKVYYNDSEVDEYIISDDYLEFDSSLDIDENNLILGKIDIGTLTDDIIDKVNTNGEIIILDKDDNVIDTSTSLKTGDKFKVNLPNFSLTYKISIAGDITGDGMISKEDIVLGAKHLVKGNMITEAEYLRAADFDSSNTIDINDIIKMSKQIKDSGDTNE